MFFAPVDEDRELNSARTPKINQLVEGRSNSSSGIEHVVNQHNIAILDVARQVRSIHDRLSAYRREIVTIKRNVEYANRRPRTFQVSNLIRHSFGQGNAATSDTHQKEVSGTVIFLNHF
jgi:hypothetical protein